MPITELSEAKMNAKFGFFRNEWPTRGRGWTQIRDGIAEVHAVATEFTALNNRNEESGDVTRQGVARRNAPAAERLLGRLSTAVERAERETEVKLAAVDSEAEDSVGEDATNGKFADEIRGRLYDMDRGERFRFVEQRMRAKDVSLFKAINSAPAWLSGLTDDEKAALTRIFREAGDPEVEATKHQLGLAINELKRAAKNAEGLIRSNTDFSVAFGGEQGPATPEHASPVQRIA